MDDEEDEVVERWQAAFNDATITVAIYRERNEVNRYHYWVGTSDRPGVVAQKTIGSMPLESMRRFALKHAYEGSGLVFDWKQVPL